MRLLGIICCHATVMTITACGSKTGVTDERGASDLDGSADASVSPPCVDPDRDGDGHRSLLCGGDDCDDLRADTHPGAPELSDWVVEVVVACPDDAPRAGCATTQDFTVDSELGPIVAYLPYAHEYREEGDPPARLATRTAGSWDSEATEFDFVFAVEASDGRIHAIVEQAGSSTVAVRDSAAWRTEYDLGPDLEARGLYLSYVYLTEAADLVTSAGGRLHGIFQCQNALVPDRVEMGVCYLEGAGDEWLVERAGAAPSPVLWYVDLVVADGVSYACAGNPDDVYGPDRYYERVEGVWSSTEAEYCDYLAVDDDGTVHVVATSDRHFWGARYSQDPGPAMDIEYIDGSFASGAEVDEAGRVFTVLAIDNRGGSDRFVTLAIREGGRWRFDLVEEDTAGGAQLVVKDGTVHVVYYSSRAGEDDFWGTGIHYAFRSPPEGIDQDCDGGDR